MSELPVIPSREDRGRVNIDDERVKKELAEIRTRLQAVVEAVEIAPGKTDPPGYPAEAVSDALWLDDYAFSLETEVEQLRRAVAQYECYFPTDGETMSAEHMVWMDEVVRQAAETDALRMADEIRQRTLDEAREIAAQIYGDLAEASARAPVPGRETSKALRLQDQASGAHQVMLAIDELRTGET